MIDYEFFKKILNQEDDGYIEDGDFLDKNIVSLFAKSKKQKVVNLFKKYGKTYKPLYSVELECMKCGKTWVVDMNKTKFIEHITALHYTDESPYKASHILCNECLEEYKNRQNELNRIRGEEEYKERTENTKEFIKKYLSAFPTIEIYVKWSTIRYANVDFDMVAEYIQEMNYYTFLNTIYWKVVAKKVKERAGYRCQLCNSSENLNVHHRSYRNHGYEVLHLEDLICLCHECHEKHHFE